MKCVCLLSYLLFCVYIFLECCFQFFINMLMSLSVSVSVCLFVWLSSSLSIRLLICLHGYATTHFCHNFVCTITITRGNVKKRCYLQIVSALQQLCADRLHADHDVGASPQEVHLGFRPNGIRQVVIRSTTLPPTLPPPPPPHPAPSHSSYPSPLPPAWSCPPWSRSDNANGLSTAEPPRQQRVAASRTPQVRLGARAVYGLAWCNPCSRRPTTFHAVP